MIPIRDILPSRRFPAVTIALIAINLLVFLYQGYIGTRPPLLGLALGANGMGGERARTAAELRPPPDRAPPTAVRDGHDQVPDSPG